MPSQPHPNRCPEPHGIRAGFLVALLLAVAAILAGAASFFWNQKPSSPPPAAPSVAALPSKNQPPPPAIPALSPPTVLTPGPTVDDTATARLLAELSDESLPLKARCEAARALARLGSAAAMSALKNALAANSPPYLKAAIAAALGECPNPEARILLNELIHGPDEITARGAARGLALRGDLDAMNTLGSLLLNEQTPASVRTEAALSLGDLKLPGAQALLMRAMTEIQDETIVENVLAGMAKRPFAETQFFFNNYLGATSVPVESKVAAIEALGNASGGATAFLLNYLSHPDAGIRAAAAWSLITAGNESDLSPRLTDALKQETDPAVRSRLYQALENQGAANLSALLPLIQNESDPAARLAGLNFIAGTLSSASASDARVFFNQTAVPELRDTALNSESPQTRLASVLALKRAGTPEALSALQNIVQKSIDPKVLSAARFLIIPNSEGGN